MDSNQIRSAAVKLKTLADEMDKPQARAGGIFPPWVATVVGIIIELLTAAEPFLAPTPAPSPAPAPVTPPVVTTG